MNNWWDNFEYKSNKNYKNNKEYKHFNKKEALIKYRDRVHFYYELEASTDKLLCEYLCDENGNEILWLMTKVDMIICHYFLLGKSANNCAMAIKEYFDKKGL